MNAKPLFPALLAALLATGCPDTEPNPPASDAGTRPDAGLVDAGAPDAGEADAGVLQAKRSLVPMPLLGDTAVENLVHCPHFDLMTELWYGFSGGDLLELWRVDLPSTPTRLPALELRPALGARFLVGMVRGGPAPMLASVWLGRAVEAPEAEVSYAIYALGESSTQDVAFELQPVEGSEQEHDGIRWRRYAGRIDEELLGVGAIILSDDGGASLYVNGPELLKEKPAQGMAPNRPVAAAASREPTAQETRAVRRAMEELKKRAPRLPPDPADGVWRHGGK